MKNFGYDRNNAYQDFEPIPKGAYVLKIMAVKYEEGQEGKSDKLRLQVDVVEGEYKDYYKKQYESDTREDKKWRGVIEIWCPKNDGSERDGWTKKTFDTCFAAIEDSNPGFRFNGTDERTLVGKLVGGVIYREDYEKDGQVKTTYKFNKQLITVDAARKGTYRTPKDKIIEAGSNVQTDAQGYINIPSGTEEELPF